MCSSDDTEVLLAIVSSLLCNPVDDQTLLLDALVRANGNVEDAVRLLDDNQNATRTDAIRTGSKVGDKRKRPGGLDGWLLSASEKSGNEVDASSSPAKKPRSRTSTTAPAARNLCPNAAPEETIAEFVEGNSNPPMSPVKVKPVSQSEFLSLFRPPAANSAESPPKPSPPKFPPLTLTTPELVAKHTPCTMHLSVLPPELACRYVFVRSCPDVRRRSYIFRLFYTMLDESETWQKNKWWLFDRVVESPHRTSFYIRRSPSGENSMNMQEAAQFWCVLFSVPTGVLLLA